MYFTIKNLFTIHGLPCRPGVLKKVLTNKLRSEEQGNQGKEDCTNKSEAKDTTQGIQDILRKRKFTNIGARKCRVVVITMIKAFEGGKSSW